jgi:hypothetical protein
MTETLTEKPDMNDPDPVSMVLRLADYHDKQRTWAFYSPSAWVASITEEVAELGLSLAGLHEHPPDYEMAQIAACAINFIRYWRRKQLEARTYLDKGERL